jgi:hypothetical protein
VLISRHGLVQVCGKTCLVSFHVPTGDLEESYREWTSVWQTLNNPRVNKGGTGRGQTLVQVYREGGVEGWFAMVVLGHCG